MNKKTTFWYCSVAICALFSSLSCHSSEPAYTTLDFSQPEMKWRPIPLWFWNNTTVVGSTLEEQLTQMIETDYYGGCGILPFGTGFSPSYLSDQYFEVYGRAVKRARELGAQMSLYDEYGFPSGSMGAINGSGVTTFKNNHPDHTIKRLDKTEYSATGGSVFTRSLALKGKLMSLVGWNRQTKEIVNLRDSLSDGTLHWQVPEGTWKVMLFQCVVDGDPNVDYLSREAVNLFIHDTHEAYYSHFGSDFGSTIASTFFDEPTMYRASGRMWTNDFNEQFEERYGISPETFYPALWYDIGPQTAAVRNLLFGLRSTLYSEGFMGTIGKWADEHHILATGHQDQEEIANPTSVAGDLMLDGKHLSMPGIDKIGGPVGTENFYKVVSSSANNWDKDYVMSETYGAMGNIPMETMYQIAIEQYTKGINHMIPHAVWYNDQNVTFLPELSWRNPIYNADLPRFNRFLSRLNYMLARPGRHVADVAVLYPIQTQYAGHYLDGSLGYYNGGVEVPNTDYPLISRLLTDELGVDFTFLHPEVLDERCSVAAGRISLNNETNREQFSTLILPSVKAISLSNMKQVEKAWEDGVTVIFTTQKPSQSASLDADDATIQAIVERMFTESEGRKAIFVSSPTATTLGEALAQSPVAPDVSFEGDSHPFNYLHKVIDGHHVYYFGNIDAKGAESDILLREPIDDATWMNPHTGASEKAEFSTTDDGRRRLKLSLYPNQSVFLVEDALIEKNGAQEEPEEYHSSYTIEASITIEKLSGSLCFSGIDNNNYYMWQFNVSEPTKPRLRPHRWVGGGASVLGEVNLPTEARIVRNRAFQVRLEIVDEKYVRTFINDVLVDERSGSFPFGKIGFRQAHDDTYSSEETARFDDIRITMADGRVVFNCDFTGTNPFNGGRVTAGWLRVEGNMSTDILVWLKELPDGIEIVPPLRASASASMWNLQGMPLTTAPSRDIYIIDGRKVLNR